MADDLDIEIRRAEPEDHPGLARLHGDPSVVRGTLQLPFPSREGWRHRLAEPRPGAIHLVAVAGGEIVGSAGLVGHPENPRRQHAAGLGLTVAEDFQGRGIGRRLLEALVSLADDWLALTRLELEVFTDNARAIQLYESVGFVIEGTLSHYAFRAGRYADVHAMARIRPPPG